MPVQIPQLERMNPQEPGSVGRVQVDLPNLNDAQAPLLRGVGAGIEQTQKAVEEYSRAVRHQELSTKDLKATELANNLETWGKTQLAGIDQKKGDTSPDYQSYDGSYAEQKAQALASVDDPEIASMLQSKLQRVDRTLGEQRNIQQIKQYYGYQNDVVKNSVKLQQDNALNASSILDHKNPSSFASTDTYLQNIISYRVAQGQQNGMITGYDENGQPKWSPVVEAQIREDIGDAIKPMVKSLNAIGKANEGKMMIDRWGSYLNAADKAKLLADNDDASLKNRALDQLSVLTSKYGQNLSVDQINGVQGIGEDVKLKMREINHTNELQREYETNQKRDVVMNQMYQEIQNSKASTRPYVSPTDFKDRSTLWKNNKDMLTPAQMSTIEKLVTRVDTTDPSAFNEAMQMVREGSLQNLNGDSFLSLRSRIADDVWDKMFSGYMRNISPDNQPERMRNISFGSKELNTLIEQQVDQFGQPLFAKNKKGKYTGPNDEQWTASAQQELADYVSSSSKLTVQDIRSKASEITNRLVKTKQDNKSWIERGMDSFRATLQQNGFIGGKAPSLSASEPVIPRTPIQPTQAPAIPTQTPRSQMPGGSTPPTTPTQAPAAPTQTPGASAAAPQASSGGNRASWSITQWRRAFYEDPAHRNDSFNGDRGAELKAIQKYKTQQLGM